MRLPELLASSLPLEHLSPAIAVAGSNSAMTAPGSEVILFLLGLITGVAATVLGFCAWIYRRAARSQGSYLGFRTAEEEDNAPGPSEQEASGESADSPSRPQPRMPWERPEDWWRRDS